MSELWNRLEALLSVHAPDIAASLRPPATEEQIAAVEQAMGVQFPDDIRAAYLRHDGGGSEFDMPMLFVPGYSWCTLEEMLDRWNSMCGIVEDIMKGEDADLSFPPYDTAWDDLAIRPEWWNRHWIPLGLTNTSSTLYVDLQPAARGIRGQLIMRAADSDEAVLFAPSLNDYLITLIERLERGAIAYLYRDGGWVEAKTKRPIWDWTTMDTF